MTPITHESIANALERYLELGGHPLEPLQTEVVRDHIADLRAGNNSGYTKRPTGTGKTVIFSAILDATKDLIFENIGEDNDGALIIVDTTHSAEQAYNTLTSKLRRDGSGLPLFGWSPDDVKVFYGSGAKANERRKVEALNAPVVIMTLAAYRARQAAGWNIREKRPMVIIDEVDWSKGETNTPLIRKLTSNNFMWGFSATDRYAGPNGLVRIGPELFGRESPIHETSIMKAAQQKETSPVRNIVLVANLESGIERRLRGDEREYTSEESHFIARQPGRDDAAIKAITEFVDPETGIAFKDLNQIWYCYGIEHAERIAERLNSIYQNRNPDGPLLYPHGYAVAVSGDTPKDDVPQEDGTVKLGLNSILELHRQGVIPTLTNADLLIRSFDSPATELCVMLRATRSPALAEQAGGRISRLNSNNPNKLGYVASFIDHDMAGALVFTDITGDAKLGMQPGVKYATHNAPRQPHLKRLNPDRKVDVEVYWEPRDIQAFFEKRRSDKEKLIAELPSVIPEEFLYEYGFVGEAKVSHEVGKYFFQAVRRAYDALDDTSDTATFSLGTFDFSAKDVGYYRDGTRDHRSGFAIHKKRAPVLREYIQKLANLGRNSITLSTFSIDPDWFSASELGDVSSAFDSHIRPIFNRMVPNGPSHMVDPKYSEHRWHVTAQKRRQQESRCMHVEDITKFLTYYGIGVLYKTPQWLTSSEIGKKIAADSTHLSDISDDIKKVMARLEPIDGRLTHLRDPETGFIWMAQPMQHGMGKHNCLHESEVQKFSEIYDFKSARKTYEWLNKQELAERSQVSVDTVGSFFAQLEPVSEKQGYMRNPVDGREWRVERRREAGIIIRCLHTSNVENFALFHKYSERPDNGEWLSHEDLGGRLKGNGDIQKILAGCTAVSGAEKIADFSYLYDAKRNLWKARPFRKPSTEIILLNFLHISEVDRFAKQHGFEVLPLASASSPDFFRGATFTRRIPYGAIPGNEIAPYIISVHAGNLAVEGFSATSDEVTESASPQEGEQVKNGLIRLGNAFMDFEDRSLKIGGEQIDLSESEFLVLYRIAKDPDAPLHWRALSDFVGENSRSGLSPQESTISQYVSKIRTKIRPHDPNFAASLSRLEKGQYKLSPLTSEHG